MNKKYWIGTAITFVGILMMYPATIALMKYGAEFPHPRLFSGMWLIGPFVSLVGLFLSRNRRQERK